MRGWKQLLLLAFSLSIGVAVGAWAQDQQASIPGWSGKSLAAALKDVESADPNTKWKAALTLGLAQEAGAAEAIARLFEERRWEFWQVGAWALGNTRSTKARDLLLSRLADDRYASYVAPALAAMGDPGAVGPLIERLTASDQHTRGAAILALGRLKGARAVPELLTLLGDKTVFTDRSEVAVKWDPAKSGPTMSVSMRGVAIYKAAVQALVQIGDRSAIKPLEMQAAKESDPEIQKLFTSAAESLRGLP